MKITCIDKDLKAVLESGYFVIPRFQRPYLWDRENVEEFWADSVLDTEGEHFIGSIVVYKTKEGKLGIVDGQQRLTTATMVLCAIRNTFLQHDLETLARGVHRLVERPDLSDKLQFVIQSETSYPYLQEYIQKWGTPEVQPPVGNEEQLLRDAFALLSEEVQSSVAETLNTTHATTKKQQSLVEKRLEVIRDRILALKLIFIELDAEDDAYVIFETLNTRGKDLRVADLVKNHLTRLLKPKNINVDLTKEQWNALVDLIEQSSSEITVDNFLHHYWLSRREYTTSKKLFKALRRVIKKDNAKQFLDELTLDARTYRELHETSFRKWSPHEAEIRQSLDALNTFRVKQDLPMILAAMREYREGRLKKKQLERLLNAIEDFHFMFTAITSQRSSGGISFMYAMHARELSAAPSRTKRVAVISELTGKLRGKRPSYAEFEADFVEKVYSRKFPKDKRLIQYILARLYQYHNASGVPIDFTKMTIEHLAPENPGTSAKALPDYVVARLGNLILVDEETNNKLANKAFPDKKLILKHTSVWVDDRILNATSWGQKEIEERSKYLASLAYERVWLF